MTILPAAQFVAPVIQWWVIAPIIIVLGGGVLGVLVEAFAPVKLRRSLGILVALTAPVAAGIVLASLIPAVKELPHTFFADEIAFDYHTVIVQGILLLVGLLSVLLVAERTSVKDGAFAGQPSDRPGSYEEELSTVKGYQRSEMFSLMLLSLGGMMVFPVANSFVVLFVALEVMSLPLYILAATARRRRQLSQEAGMKYFILGAFASAFVLMGSAFIYGAVGNLYFHEITRILLEQMQGALSPELVGLNLILEIGILLVMVGLLFKVGAAPFHAWTPDVYTGAPTPITGFMAAAVKVAAFGALIRFFIMIGAAHYATLLPIYLGIIFLTIVVGTFGGLVQFDIKRLLAYSSIAHAGYILLGLFSGSLQGLQDVYFYLLAYALSTVGAFGIVSLVRGVDAEGNVQGEVTDWRRWAGLGRTNPLVAGAFTLFLLSFAGIPLTAGFIGKFLVFKDAMNSVAPGMSVMVFVALVSSAITAFFYFRVVRVLFFDQPTGDTKVVASEGFSSAAILLAAIGTVVLGVFPTAVLGLAF